MIVRLGKNLDPISKITTAKRTGGVAQVVKYLLSKHKTLTSNVSMTKIKNKQRNPAGQGASSKCVKSHDHWPRLVD
jgi:hypothetical protein